MTWSGSAGKIGGMQQKARVEVWLTRTCPFCIAARRMLVELAVQYEVHDLSEHPNRRAATTAILEGHTSVPLILIDGEAIGGYTELSALHSAGELLPRIFAES